ncbi:MAG: DVUA0089 family protein [Pirellulaceae bacterium]
MRKRQLSSRRHVGRRLCLETLEHRLLMAADVDDELSEAIFLGAASTTAATYDAAIVPDTDVDMYRFTVSSNQVVDFDIDTPINGPGGLGSYLRLFNSQGAQLAFNNDAFAPGEDVLGFDSYLRHTFASSGTYYIGVSNANNTAYNAVNGTGDTAGGLHTTGTYKLTLQALPIDADDALSEATALGAISTTAVTASANITPDIDVDMYRFTVNANQVVDFDIDTTLNGIGGLGSYLRLFNSQGEQLAFNNDGMAPGENLLGFDAYLRYTFSSRGTYYLGVSNANNTQYNAATGSSDTAGGLHAIGDYQLIVQTAPAIPNDTDDEISEATALGSVSSTPKTVTASITPNVDVDMYRFSVTANQIVDFDIDTAINGPGGLGSYLRLFNSQGQELASNDNAFAPGENTVGFDAYLRHAFSQAGTYYLAVSNANNTEYSPTTGSGDVAGGEHSTGDYTLTIQALPVDSDDQLSEAPSLGVITRDPDTITDSIVTDIDVDLFRFTVASGQVVDFDIDTAENGPDGLGSYLRLFNAQGQQLASNNDAAAPGELVVGFDAYLRYTFTSSGTYYIGVSNFNNITYNPTTGSGDTAGGRYSIGSYQLIVQTAPGSQPDDDDEMSEATVLGAISTSAKTVDAEITPDVDVDMYRFTVTAGQVVDFDVDTPLNGPGGLGSYLRLFNSQDQQLAFNNSGAAPGENEVGFDAYLRYTFASGGTYYVGVSNSNNTQYDPESGEDDTAGGSNAVGSYQLIVQALPVDTDDSLNEATLLGAVTTTPQIVSNSIVTDIDVDIYRFTVNAGQIVGFDIDTLLNAPGGLGSYLRLFNDQGQQLAFNNNGVAIGETVLGIDAYLQYTFTERGTYYLGVSNSNNTQYNPLTGTGDTAGGDDSIGAYSLAVQAIQTGNPSLNLSVNPATIREDGGTTTATITRTNGDDSQALVVNLASNDVSEASVTTTVTIPANSISTTFAILGVDDSLLDGTQTATISASADGYSSASVNVQITDFETVTVTISPTAMSENGGTATGTVTRSNTDNASSLTVTLESSDETEAHVPSLIVIPAGESSVSFVVTAQDDTLLDGTQTVTIDASATNYFGIGATVDVTDFEALEVTITAATMSEHGGSASATVRRANSNLGAAVTVTLTSSDTSEATVPASVTIPAGSATASFVVTAVDDALLDGTRTVTVTASAAGYVSGNDNVDVTDYETLVLTIDPTAISEDGGFATGTVVRSNTDDRTSLIVSLASDDTSEATVPVTITIPADSASATFVITGVDDSVADRTQHVVVTASAAGFISSSAGLDVTDDEPVLLLTLTGDLLSEHGGTINATVSRMVDDLSVPLVVSLASSDVTAAVVPATVTIPAGESSAVFIITGVDDPISDGVQRTTITVTASGFLADGKEILVADDERPYQNPREVLDVNGDTLISPLDALLIINILNSIGSGPAAVIMGQYEGPALFPDTTGNNSITPLDALLIINRLNEPDGEAGEGESTFGDTLSTASAKLPLATALVDEVYTRLGWAWYGSTNSSAIREKRMLHGKRN